MNWKSKNNVISKHLRHLLRTTFITGTPFHTLCNYSTNSKSKLPQENKYKNKPLTKLKPTFHSRNSAMLFGGKFLVGAFCLLQSTVTRVWRSFVATSDRCMCLCVYLLLENATSGCEMHAQERANRRCRHEARVCVLLHAFDVRRGEVVNGS